MVSAALSQAKVQESVTWVGVHIRRTDYASHLQDLYQLPLLDREYFTRAMEYFTRLHHW